MERQAGATTKQMRDAPQRAVFVWCNWQLRYPKDLARHLGRADLEIIAPIDLEIGTSRLRGREITGLVVDHAAHLTVSQLAGLDAAKIAPHSESPPLPSRPGLVGRSGRTFTSPN